MKQIENINGKIKGLRVILSPYKIDDKFPDELNGFVEGSGQFGYFIVFNDEIIGFVSIGDPLKTRKKELFISCVILEKYRKQYFAYEAVFYLLDDFMAKGLKYYNSARKEIYLSPRNFYVIEKKDNIASKKLVEKLGFKFEKEVELSDELNSVYRLNVDEYYAEWDDSLFFIDKKLELSELIKNKN